MTWLFLFALLILALVLKTAFEATLWTILVLAVAIVVLVFVAARAYGRDRFAPPRRG